MEQIEALIALSDQCEQKIQYQCRMAPLKNVFMNVNYGWWVDNRGNERFYFDGADSSNHVCGCYEAGTCAYQAFNSTCNCDLSGLVALWTEDSGKITNKTDLPIRSFKYGGFFNENQAAKVSIGKLQCRGKAKSSNVSISTCSSLKKAGASIDGFYLTKTTPEEPLSASYCSLSSPGYIEEQLFRPGGPLKPTPDRVTISTQSNHKCGTHSSSCSSNWSWINGLTMEPLTSKFLVVEALMGKWTFKENGTYSISIVEASNMGHTKFYINNRYTFTFNKYLLREVAHFEFFENDSFYFEAYYSVTMKVFITKL